MISAGVKQMATRIVCAGNTLTVAIPEELAAQAGLAAGDPVEWIPSGNGSLTLVNPARTASKKKPADMTLEELLEGIPEGAQMEELDWGPPRGAEVWWT
jgi:antitoxin component of MazEF toxin-antitoxin module